MPALDDIFDESLDFITPDGLHVHADGVRMHPSDADQPEWDPDEQELVRAFVMEFAIAGAPADEFDLPGGMRVVDPTKFYSMVARAVEPGPSSPDYGFGLSLIWLVNESRRGS